MSGDSTKTEAREGPGEVAGVRLVSWAERAALAATVAAAAGYLALFFFIASSRASYPFELEWLEGTMLHEVTRVVDGQPLYEEPSLEYTPFIYPPLYFWLSALTAKVVGVGFLALRLVSIAAAAGCFALLYLLVWRETDDPWAGVVSAGFFSACYHIGGGWLDIGRVDSLFLCLTLASAYAFRQASSWRGHTVAGLLACAACLAKQSAVLLPLLLVAYALITRRGAMRFTYGLTFGASYGLATLLLQLGSAGWYVFYVFTLPSLHPWEPSLYLDFWLVDLLASLPIACALSLFALVFWPLRTELGRWGFWYALLAALLGIAWGGRLNWGGWLNVLVPAYAALGLASGVAFGLLRRAAGASRRLRILRTGLYLALFFQLLQLRYPAAGHIPLAADREVGESFVEHLRGVDGEVLIASSPYLGALAGKGWQAHVMALQDIVISKPDNLAETLLAELRQRVTRQRYARIYLGLRLYSDYLPEFYASTDFALPADRFYPVTGIRARPDREYEPRSE